MDQIDRKLLALIQQDATLTVAELAERVGISSTPLWKRVKRLESEGVIDRRVALLDAASLGLKLTGFVLDQDPRSQPVLAGGLCPGTRRDTRDH